MTELNMDSATCEEQITDLVLEMLDEGVLSDQFSILCFIRLATGDHLPLVKKIHLYCTQIEKDLAAFSSALTESDIGNTRALKRAAQLRLRSFWIGAEAIQTDCQFLLLAGLVRDQEMYEISLRCLYRAYSRLRPKFMRILQLEIQIFRLRQSSS